MAKCASIFTKLGRKVVLMIFFENQLDNCYLHDHGEPENAKYIDFFAEKCRSRMDSFRENGNWYRKSDLIF